MRKVQLFLAMTSGLFVLIHYYLAFHWSPPEQTMHDLVRIMYFHVASAWIAFLSIFVTSLYSIIYLVRRDLKFDRVAVSSAEIGVAYTTITLLSGSIWGKAIWQTWWTWDPRLTTTLILWFLYVGYLLLRGTVDGMHRRARVSAIFAIIASIDVPIIHMSVTWWRSIHPTVIDDTGFHMPGSMVFTLMFGFLSFFVLYLTILLVRTRYEAQKTQLLDLRQRILAVRALKSGVEVDE